MATRVRWLGEANAHQVPVDVRYIRAVRNAIAVLPGDGPRDPLWLAGTGEDYEIDLHEKDIWSPAAELARYHADFWPEQIRPQPQNARWKLTIPKDLVDLQLAPAPQSQAVVLAHAGWIEIWRLETWHEMISSMKIRKVSRRARAYLSLSD